MQSIMHFIANNVEVFLIGTLLSVFLLSRLRRVLDGVLAAFAYLLFAVFLGYVVMTLPQVDLTIIVVGVLVLAAIDFWVTVRAGGNGGNS